VSPQHSNRDNLLEGALRCLERLPPERVTARVIAEESGANLASIGYHFGSKDELVTAAVVEGLDRWLGEIAARLSDLPADAPGARLRRAGEVLDAGGHTGLTRTFVAALARAQHDADVRARLVEGFTHTRPALAAVLGFGEDETAADAAALVLALFHGLLLQRLLDPGLAIEGERLERAQARLREALPTAR